MTYLQELNALAAEYIIDRRVVRDQYGQWRAVIGMPSAAINERHDAPPFAEDNKLALIAVERFEERFEAIVSCDRHDLVPGRPFHALVGMGHTSEQHYDADGETAAEALVLAMLKALGRDPASD